MTKLVTIEEATKLGYSDKNHISNYSWREILEMYKIDYQEFDSSKTKTQTLELNITSWSKGGMVSNELQPLQVVVYSYKDQIVWEPYIEYQARLSILRKSLTNYEFGYNILNCSPEGRTKVYNKEFRHKLGNGQRGKKASEETRKKMSDARKGKPIHSQEFKDRLSIRAKNAVISDETRRKISESAKERTKKFGSNFTNYNNKRKLIP